MSMTFVKWNFELDLKRNCWIILCHINEYVMQLSDKWAQFIQSFVVYLSCNILLDILFFLKHVNKGELCVITFGLNYYFFNILIGRKLCSDIYCVNSISFRFWDEQMNSTWSSFSFYKHFHPQNRIENNHSFDSFFLKYRQQTYRSLYII